jgi:hypothetical protein
MTPHPVGSGLARWQPQDRVVARQVTGPGARRPGSVREIKDISPNGREHTDSPPCRQEAGFMDCAAALTAQNQELGELLRDADWSLPVPTCPGWTLLELLRHVGRGDRWAAQIITDRADASLDPRLVRDSKPPADVAGAIGWLSQSPLILLAAVEDIGPRTEVSTVTGPKPAAWWTTRRLHEATVHRAGM